MDSELFTDLIGIPYKINGRDSSGYDCYGLIIEIGKRLNFTFPDFLYTVDYYKRDKFANDMRSSFIKIEAPEFGCVVAIKTGKYITHVGVMLDHCRFIHSVVNVGVSVSRIDNTRYKQHIEGYYKWIT